MRGRRAKANKIPEAVIVAAVACPYCGAEKYERCHQHSTKPFGIERGRPCRLHRQRVTRYRRRLTAHALTRPLDETKPLSAALSKRALEKSRRELARQAAANASKETHA